MDKSLKSLALISNLERLNTALFYDKEEYEYVVNHLPHLKIGQCLRHDPK